MSEVYPVVMDSDIAVESLPQNGPYGCATACLANVGRILLNQDLSPTVVDVELQRNVDDDLLGYDRTLWMLRKGLKVHALLDPESLIVEDYLAGTKSYDQILHRFAERYYNGDLDAAVEDYGSDDYRQFVQRLKDRKPEYEAELEEYARNGSYTEELRPVEYSDLENSLQAGKVALIASGVEGSLGHQLLLFSEETGDDMYPQLYYPDEEQGLIFGVDLYSIIDTKFIDTDETYLISR